MSTASGIHTPPPCSNMGLSKHGGPVFPHVWAFFGTIGFVVPLQSRKWCVALCRAAGGVRVGGQSDGVGVVPCAVVLWGVCWAGGVGEGWGGG